MPNFSKILVFLVILPFYCSPALSYDISSCTQTFGPWSGLGSGNVSEQYCQPVPTPVYGASYVYTYKSCSGESATNLYYVSVGYMSYYAGTMNYSNKFQMKVIPKSDPCLLDPCANGVQNGDETGVDCGGSCPCICPGETPPEVDSTPYWAAGVCTGHVSSTCGAQVTTYENSYCCEWDGVLSGEEPPGVCVNPTDTDGIKNPNEEGIDCGGSNPAPCVNKCPDGYSPASNYTNLQHVILFGFFSSGDYSNDPNACVKLDPYNPFVTGPADCNKTWLSYDVDGVSKTFCGELRKTYPAAAVDDPLPPLEVEIVFPSDPSSSGPAPGGQIIPDTSAPPVDAEIPNANNCETKTMSDGSVCTVCFNPASVNCVGASGTLSATKPTEQTPIVDGCNKITYGNGTTCDVCRDPDTGVQTVTCKDVGESPVDPSTVSPSAIGDGLLGGIDKKIGDVRGQLQGIGAGISGIAPAIAAGNNLQGQANAYLKTIAEKPSGNTTVNVNTSGIESRLDKMVADTTPNQAAAVEQMNTGGDAALTPIDSTFQSGITQIQAEFQPSHMPVDEGISGRLTSVLPSFVSCQDLVVTVFAGHQVTIPCAPFERFKTLFFWLLNCWTVINIYEILFSSAPKRT